MDPVAFYIGPIPVPWYGLLVVTGMLLAAFFSYIEWNKRQLDRTYFKWLFSLIVVTSFFGARWFYLMFNPGDIQGVASFFTISSGRSIIGGVIFSSLITSIVIDVFNIPVDKRELMSCVMPNMLLAQSIGRWGNFANQELYGAAVASLDYLPEFISNGMYIDEAYRQPLFLYESILDFAGWIFITLIIKNIEWFKLGTHGSIYLMWYGVTRASMELLRDPQYIMNVNGFPTSFFWSIMFIVAGVISFIVLQFYYDKFDHYVTEILPYKTKHFWNESKLLISSMFSKEISYYLNINIRKENYSKELNRRKSNLYKYTLSFQGDYYVRK